jgi:hypothetical protein
VAEAGFITPETAMHVLKTYLGDERVRVVGENTVLVITDDDPRVYPLGKVVTRNMILAMANRHKVPSHLFWHPEMLVAGPKGAQ